MSGIVGSKFNIRGSGLVGSLGTDGQHMLSAGAGKTNVFETVAAAAAGLTMIKSVTASGAASVDFVNGTSDVVLDSTYPIYKIYAYNMTCGTDDTNVLIRFSDDTGTSFETSGYYTITHRNIALSLNTGLAHTGSAMEYNNLGSATNEEGAFEFTLFNPSSDAHFTHFQSKGTTTNKNSAVTYYDSAGVYEATADIDGVQVLMSSGTISGTFKFYGLKA
jgi:hypothetical protein